MLEDAQALIRLVAEKILPPDIKLFSVGRKCLFELRGESGLITEPNTHVAYLVKVIQGEHFRYSFKFKDLELAMNHMGSKALLPHVEKTFREAVTEFQKFLNDPKAMEKARKEHKELTPQF